MKSCLGLLITFTILVAVVGGGGLIYYLSKTSEFSRTAGERQNLPQPPSAR